MTSTTGRSDECRGHRTPRGGFTLLELVLVMVIICTALGMAAPSLRGFFTSRQTTDAAAQIVALAQYARTSAIAQGRTFRLNVDTRQGAYWLTAQTGGAFQPLASDFGRVFRLPEGTAAVWETPEDAEARGWIVFHPDGRTEAAAIRLVGRQGSSSRVICPSPAERFRVEASGDDQ